MGIAIRITKTGVLKCGGMEVSKLESWGNGNRLVIGGDQINR